MKFYWDLSRGEVLGAVLMVVSLGVPVSAGAQATAADQLTGKLVITGSSTIAPLIAEIAKRFEQQNPGVRVDVQTGGSSRGISDARNGLADIGMVSRALKPEENDLSSHILARDGVTLIVHASNPVTALTEEQVVGIYTGRIQSWKDAGGVDAPITVVNKAEGRSTLELFLAYFQLKAEEVKPSVVIGDNEQGVKTVAGNPEAIGYVSVGSAGYAAMHGVPIKLLPLDGVAASSETVVDGSFPLARPLVLVTKPRPGNPLVRPFLDFALSAEVNDLILALSFVPVR
ncbi:MAG: phosphate ABC transporter substrate-binding protein [Chromatiales bacterium]